GLNAWNDSRRSGTRSVLIGLAYQSEKPPTKVIHRHAATCWRLTAAGRTCHAGEMAVVPEGPPWRCPRLAHVGPARPGKGCPGQEADRIACRLVGFLFGWRKFVTP